MPYKAGPGQQLPSQLLQGAASAQTVHLARESGYLPRKGTQGSPPPRPCGLFSRFRALGGGEGCLGKAWGRDKQWAKTLRLPREGDCFLIVYDVGPTLASVSSLDNWDRVTVDIMLDRI